MIASTLLALVQDPAPVAEPKEIQPATGIAIGLVLVALSIGGLRIARFVVDFVSPPIERARTPWNLAHVTLLLLCLVSGIMLIGYLVPSARPDPDDVVAGLMFSAAATGVFTLGALAIAGAFGSQGLAAFGLRASGNVRAAIAGLATYVSCIPGLFGVALVWGFGLKIFGHEVEPQTIVTGFSQLGPGERLVPFLLGALLQPLFEEVTFRGLLQPALVQIARPVAGIVVTSILFAALHGFDAFLPIFALSVILGWIRERTQSLAACWAVHTLHNGAQLAWLFFYAAGPATKPGWLFGHA